MSKRRPTKQQKTRQNTGDILWMVFGSGIGLPLGLAVGSTVARRRDPDHTGQQVSDESR